VSVATDELQSLDVRVLGAMRPSIAPEVPRELALPETDELFRGIYTRAAMGYGQEILAITSATPGEGKTTLSLGLAISIAQDFPDRRVLLVETDLQRSVLSDDFGIESSPGLSEALVNQERVEDVCRPTFLDNLDLLTAGGSPRGAGRLLRSARLIEALEVLRQSYHVIILDAPAVLTNSDTLLLSDLADATLFVVRLGRAPVAVVNKALEQLDESKLRGIVLNGAQSSIPGWLRDLVGLRSSGL
jgi:capsular exopolysaccharide synthesis family protein